MLDVLHAVSVYKPFDGRDCTTDQYAERLKICAGCQHRQGNSCAMDGHMLAVKARRKNSECLAKAWDPSSNPAAPVEQPAKRPGWWKRAWQQLRSVFATEQSLPPPLTRPVRVAFMTPSLESGGAERWILALCRWLEADVLGVVSTSPKIEDTMRRDLRRVGVEVTAFQETPDAARELLRGVDIILCWGIGDLSPYLENVPTPVVWVSHGACEWTTRLVYAAKPRVSHWVSVSSLAKRVFPKEVQPLATVMLNGVDVERVTPVRGRKAARAKLGLRDDQIAVGYLGRFSPEKRPCAVAEAVACLPREYVAVMVGSGWKDAETRAEAQRIAPGRVIFAGHVDHVGDMLAAFDVWVNASPSEGMCLSLIEAWLAGVPCVSTPTGALPELEAMHGELVWPVEIGADARLLAEAVRGCFREGTRTSRIDRARKLAWEQFTSAAMAARWDDYLKSIVNGGRHA